jgi:hypothetical protein
MRAIGDTGPSPSSSSHPKKTRSALYRVQERLDVLARDPRSGGRHTRGTQERVQLLERLEVLLPGLRRAVGRPEVELEGPAELGQVVEVGNPCRDLRHGSCHTHRAMC